jgi:thioredoxin reductase (NADPH)
MSPTTIVQPVITDVAIIGAGPVGLFQVFELGLLGLKAVLIDSLAEAGGQCIELYPDKPIYDIPAVPVCSGRELIERLQQQIAPFEPQWLLGQGVQALQQQADGGFELRTSSGCVVHARAVVIAGGLGAFEPRRLAVPGSAELEGSQIHYSVRDAQRFAGRELVIFGGGDSALDWALALVDSAASIVLVHRADTFRAAPASVAAMRALVDEHRLQLLTGAATEVLAGDDGRLRAVVVRGNDGVSRRVDAEDLLVFYGLHPKLGPIADWGLAIDKSQIPVDTARFETSTPGIYAVGDINTYPGKKKLILSGFHEAALAAFAIKERLTPGQKVHLQYTTTSPLMHKRLGVVVEAEAEAA